MFELRFSASLETVDLEPRDGCAFAHTRPGRVRLKNPICDDGNYAAMLVTSCFTKVRSPRSMARRYAANLRATASAAWLRLLCAASRSYRAASSGLSLGARCAASSSTVCRWRFLCFEMGIRLEVPAELFSPLHRPQ